MARSEVSELLKELHDAQRQAVERIRGAAHGASPDAVSPKNGLTVLENLRMWGWHYWTHTRDLVRLRGSLPEDAEIFHVDNLVRQACEEFGRFAGEVACLADGDLDRRPGEGGASLRETVEHVIDDLLGFLPEALETTAREEGFQVR